MKKGTMTAWHYLILFVLAMLLIIGAGPFINMTKKAWSAWAETLHWKTDKNNEPGGENKMDGLNLALRDNTKYTSPTVSLEQLAAITQNMQLLQEMYYHGHKYYLIKSTIGNNKPIYLIFNKDDSAVFVLDNNIPAKDDKVYSFSEICNLNNWDLDFLPSSYFYIGDSIGNSIRLGLKDKDIKSDKCIKTDFSDNFCPRTELKEALLKAISGSTEAETPTETPKNS